MKLDLKFYYLLLCENVGLKNLIRNIRSCEIFIELMKCKYLLVLIYDFVLKWK